MKSKTIKFTFTTSPLSMQHSGVRGKAGWFRKSEWLLFNANSAISWREQVNFQWKDDEIRFVLDQHVELDFYSASSLNQQSTGRHVAPHHSDSELTRLFFLLNVVCLAEKQQIRLYQFNSLWFEPTREHPQSIVLEARVHSTYANI